MNEERNQRLVGTNEERKEEKMRRNEVRKNMKISKKKHFVSSSFPPLSRTFDANIHACVITIGQA